ncbi:hypothetical protein ACFV3R_17115 [Streptomyces sp. NPDC059740]|uniref:terpene synthase family protein n=1 Tax=Streptomyces sp. NPDC059740 TaxID=3346926 RepID=UPI003662FF84
MTSQPAAATTTPQQPAAADPGAPPGVYCPIEPAVHPQRERIEERALAWWDRFPLRAGGQERARLVGTRAAELMCRFAPHAQEERLQVLAQWGYWAFRFDEQVCAAPEVNHRPAAFLPRAGNLLQVAAHPRQDVAEDRFAAAQGDLSRGLRRLGATPTQLRRWVEGHRAWYFAVAVEMSRLQSGAVPTVNDYLTTRLYSTGAKPVTAVLDFLHGRELSEHQYNDPAVRALTELTFFIGALDNDLQAPGREGRHEQHGVDILSVLLHEDGGSTADAVHKTVALRDRATLRFLQLRRKVLLRAGPALRQYLTSLGHMIRGNLDWGAGTPRCAPVDATAAAEGTGAGRLAVLTGRPGHEEAEPLPYPVARWWWGTELG